MEKDSGTIRLMTEFPTPLQSVGVLTKESIQDTSMLRREPCSNEILGGMTTDKVGNVAQSE